MDRQQVDLCAFGVGSLQAFQRVGEYLPARVQQVHLDCRVDHHHVKAYCSGPVKYQAA